MSAPVKSRPILMSAPMVRALLSGRKTQTRRVVKPRGGGTLRVNPEANARELRAGEWCFGVDGPRDWSSLGSEFACPYGKPGDTLWVKETWRSWAETCRDGHDDEECAPHCSQTYVAYAATPRRGFRPRPDGSAITYLDDASPLEQNPKLLGPWKPSIHMPRWASRLTLEVTGVRAERLNDISEDDAMAEGVEPIGERWRDYFSDVTPPASFSKASNSFWSLWGAINGADSWAANPWVWAISFRVVTL